MNDPKPEVASEWVAIEIDETRYYNIAEADRPLIESIWAVFFYDAVTGTYLCELTPSYHLRYLYTSVRVTDACSDEDRDRLDGLYGQESHEDEYHHVAAIKRIDASHKRPFGETFDTPAEEEDHVREHWQGNCPF